jgi:2,3-dihydroxy-p-cumate/2,3-dihydroxybenzoate 3,4-dioxygenase
MTALIDIRCVRLGTRDLGGADRFARQVVDLQAVREDGGARYYRSDQRDHTLVFPARDAGIQHVNHQVEGIDDVMRAWYQLQRMGVRTVFGPGRHPTSGAVFLYFEGPDGMVYESSTGVRTLAPEQEATYQPRQVPACPGSFCMWGSKPDMPEFCS